jgi:lipopolysaccharide biosynthesis protein
LNWANENWNRAWDASEKQLLIAQKHSPEDDIAFAASLEKAFADPRYIRVNGRPLLMVYRPAKLPDVRATVDRWRNYFERAGYGNPYLVMPHADGNINPAMFGMDAAAGFPPHQYGFGAKRRVKGWTVKLENPRYRGLVLSWDKMVRVAMWYQARTDYTLLPGICPSWDNHARRGIRGNIFHGATPKKYGAWLKATCDYVLQKNTPDESIVFVNAWNEWAEGAHLEPDRYFGYAYLAETGRVLSALASEFCRSELALVGK